MLKKSLFAIVLLFMVRVSSVHGVLADQAFMTNALPENRHFIEFLNVALTNFGDPAKIGDFDKAVLYDFNANIHFMSGEYVQSHKEVLKSQKLLRNLYYQILAKQYIPDTDKLLKMSAPIIFHAKDKKAENYLTLGYRHLAKARILLSRGLNTNRFLYSTKISIYIKAFIDIRLAKKYAIMALVESKIPMVDKDTYQTQTLNQRLKLSQPAKISQYDMIKYSIDDALYRKQLPPNYPFLLHHADNFGYIYGNKKSALSGANEKLDGNNTTPPPAGTNTPPAGGNNPPAGANTPPAGGNNPPAGGNNPPAGGNNP